MAERVEIMVVAQDSASQVLRGITSQFGELGNVIQGITGGRAVEYLTGEIIKFGKESVEAFTSSAMAAKQLSRISGETIEDSSRFIQVLDDFGLKQEDALAATRALTKQGLEPNIETLAKLSDQYRQIRDPQEKNEFILKNLGRAGLQWAQVLEQGSRALNDHAAAINKNLIITEEMWQRAEKLRIAQDDLNDSLEATKIRVGEQLVPAMSGLLKFTNDYNAAQEDQVKGWERLLPPIAMAHGAIIAITDAFKDDKEATNDAANAQDNLAESAQKSAEDLKAEQEAVQALTKANEDYLSLVGNLTNSLEDYDQKHKEIQDQLNAGKITLGEAQAKWRELADEQERASRRMILNMLQVQLSEGGLSAAETNYLLDLGLKWGVYSQTAVNEAKKAQREVANLTAQFNNLPTEKTSVINVVTNYQTFGVPSYTGGIVAGGKNTSRRAGGGDVLAGMLYQVNETRTEYFQPSMNGTVVPLGKGGGGGFTLNYAPQMSLGNLAEFQTVILPFVEKAVRQMQSDGRVPTK